MNDSRLNIIKERLSIIEDFIERNYNKKEERNIEFIVIHYTAGITSEMGAARNTRNWFNNTEAKASAHYIVDDSLIIQAVKDKDVAWHCGTNGIYYHPNCRNKNSLGIEICSGFAGNFTGYDKCPPEHPGWYLTKQAKDRAALLTAYLMIIYNIPIENVIRHYDVTHKDCPAPMVDENKNGPKNWEHFINNVIRYQNDILYKNSNSEEVVTMIYKTFEDLPEWAREGIGYFINKGYLLGDGKGNLNLSYDMIRILIILYRVIRGEN